MKDKRRNIIELMIEKTFLISSILSIALLVVILGFIVYKGLPSIFDEKVGILDFMLGKRWNPSNDEYGILYMIITSIEVSFGAIILSVPIGVLTAIFLAELAPRGLQKITRTAVELLAGIPSVIFGFFGLLVVVPIIDDVLGGGGNSILATIIILTLMILPTIITISETSIRSVNKDYKLGSLALGVSEIQSIFKVVVPAAKSGILSSVILAIGRAVGETMAVILVIGNTVQFPLHLTDRARTLTSNIALEMSYASGLHEDMLFSTALVLLVFIMVLNLILLKLKARKEAI